MAETGPISQIAEKLSDELFSEFFWTKCGPINQDWSCVRTEHGTSTHPTDVVFAYDEPYSKRRTYLQCDLKSYAKGSITTSVVKAALISLAKQVSCAEISEEWQRLYTSGDGDFQVFGLLFVYNHDGDYDKEFSSIVNSMKDEDLSIPSKARLYILGPDDIFWLDNVRIEIRQMRGSSGKNSLPSRENCEFFYPQLSRWVNLENRSARAATMEMLTSPWITMRYTRPGETETRYVVFVRRAATRSEEYEYLIDYLRHYQCLDHPDCVTVKVLADSADSTVVWGQAVDRYIRNVVPGNGDSNFANIVRSITFSPMQQIVSRFSPVAIGMER